MFLLPSPGASGSVRPMRRAFLLTALLASLVACGSQPIPPSSPPSSSSPPSPAAPAAKGPAWIERSDANARLLVDIEARFFPEDASSLGEESADEHTIDL